MGMIALSSRTDSTPLSCFCFRHTHRIETKYIQVLFLPLDSHIYPFNFSPPR